MSTRSRSRRRGSRKTSTTVTRRGSRKSAGSRKSRRGSRKSRRQSRGRGRRLSRGRAQSRQGQTSTSAFGMGDMNDDMWGGVRRRRRSRRVSRSRH